MLQFESNQFVGHSWKYATYHH